MNILTRKYVLRNTASEGDNGGGGSGYGSSTPPPPPAADPATPKESGTEPNSLDFYKDNKPEAPQPPASDKSPEASDKSKQAPTPPEPPKTTVTGYGEDDLKDDEPVVDDKKDEPAAPIEDYKDLNIEGLEAETAEKLKVFAKETGLNAEQAQKFLDLKKVEIQKLVELEKENQKAQQIKVKELRQSWVNELKSDTEFGGNNFNTSVHLVDKFVKEFLPETNKVLTSTKGMMPPSTMRDLLKLAKSAYTTSGLPASADPTVASSGDTYNPLDFYKS